MLKNKRLSTLKIKSIISMFCADVNATKAALLMNIKRNTINHYYNEFRKAIYVVCTPFLPQQQSTVSTK